MMATAQAHATATPARSSKSYGTQVDSSTVRVERTLRLAGTQPPSVWREWPLLRAEYEQRIPE
jgi:hypothetical protein